MWLSTARRRSDSRQHSAPPPPSMACWRGRQAGVRRGRQPSSAQTTRARSRTSGTARTPILDCGGAQLSLPWLPHLRRREPACRRCRRDGSPPGKKGAALDSPSSSATMSRRSTTAAGKERSTPTSRPEREEGESCAVDKWVPRQFLHGVGMPDRQKWQIIKMPPS